MCPRRPSSYADFATLQMHWKQKNAESQPARTHKDEQQKYAQHVDPQKIEAKTETGHRTDKRTTEGRDTTNRIQERGSKPSCSNQVATQNHLQPQRQPFSRSPLPALVCMPRQTRSARERHFTMCASVLPCAHLLSCETFVPEVGSPSHSFGPLSPWGLFTRINMLLR